MNTVCHAAVEYAAYGFGLVFQRLVRCDNYYFYPPHTARITVSRASVCNCVESHKARGTTLLSTATAISDSGNCIWRNTSPTVMPSLTSVSVLLIYIVIVLVAKKEVPGSALEIKAMNQVLSAV